MHQIAAALAILLLSLLSPAARSQMNIEKATFRQCRWSPFIARGEIGNEHEIPRLQAGVVSEMFTFDDYETWETVADDLSNISSKFWVPKWIFRNRGVQVMLAAALMVDKIVEDDHSGNDVLQLTAWNILLCGIYKKFDGIDVPSAVFDVLQGDDDKILMLVDYIYRLAKCLQKESSGDDCPSICAASSDVVKSCKSIPDTQNIEQPCDPVLDDRMRYKVFGGSRLTEITLSVFKEEENKFLIWHTQIQEEKKIPYEIFEANFNNDLVVASAAGPFIEKDKDEDAKVKLDKYFLSLNQHFRRERCSQPDRKETTECLQFRAIFHSKLVELQKILVKNRDCRCKIGFGWEPDLQACVQGKLGHCAEHDPCMNGGRCKAETKTIKSGTSIVLSCECAPGWKGSHCELEDNPCESQPRSSTCGQHLCQRNPSFKGGFICICPPQFYRRKSDTEPTCVDIDECSSETACLNDGECVNKDPGYICNCKHNYSGPRCEVPPKSSRWGEWEPWSRCILPQPAFSCTEFPKQVRTRPCKAQGVSQSCFGPSREVRFICPGQLAGWNVSHCDVTHKKPGAVHLKPESYLMNDFVDKEELGHFSSIDLENPLEFDSNVYINHFALLFATFTFCVSLFLLTMWCYRNLLKLPQRWLVGKCRKFFIKFFNYKFEEKKLLPTK